MIQSPRCKPAADAAESEKDISSFRTIIDFLEIRTRPSWADPGNFSGGGQG